MIRLAVRGIVMKDDQLLLVNAWPDGQCELLCCPGGGVEPHASLPENLAREIREETGIEVTVGAPALVNEFHDVHRGFHQVEVFFRCDIVAEAACPVTDPEGVVTRRVWVSREDIADLCVKPSSLASVVWGDGGLFYDSLEAILR